MADDLISQHKRMAMGESVDGGASSVDSLASKAAGGPAEGKTSGYLSDSKRSAPISGSQANPDHGPH